MYPLTKQQQLWQAKMADFCREKVASTVMTRDKEHIFDKEVLKDILKTGLSRLYWPEEFGGLDEEYLTYITALKELAKYDDGLAISASVTAGLCCEPLYRFGTDEQKAKFLVPLVNGDALGAFALTEREAGTDVGGIQTTVVKEENHYILNGEKVFITNAGAADYYIVFASTNPEARAKGLTAFILTKDMEGLTVGERVHLMGLHTSTCSNLTFTNVRVPLSHRLGNEGDGFKIAMTSLDSSRIGVAAQAVGLGETALEYAIAYTKERMQFGKSLSEFQNTQFRIAHMATQLEAAHWMLYNAVQAKEAGLNYTTAASMAKKFCSDMAMDVTEQAVQLLGGNGYSEDYPVARLMRNAKVTQIYEGTNEAQQMIIAGALLR